jgi:hypothetical protein
VSSALLKDEQFYVDGLNDVVMLAERPDDYRVNHNEIVPQCALPVAAQRRARGAWRFT